jgi:hypothetical protein
MNKRLALTGVAAVCVATSLPVQAVFMTYTDRATFDAAAPGLPVETFENNSAAGIVSFPDPLDSTTNNGTFAPGDILPGISFSVIDNGGSGDLVLLPAGSLGGGAPPTDVVGPNTFVEALQIDLLPAVTAIGLDVFGLANPNNLNVSFFDGGSLLGSVTVFAGSTATFVGATNFGGSITRVTTNLSDVGELVDDVAFGTPAAAPSPSVFSLMAIGLGGLVARRKGAATRR